MAAQPFFTVVIPTINRERFLRYTAGAVLGQSFVDFELIISDNGSSDGTPAYLQSIRDPRVKVIRHEQTLPVLEHFKFLFQQGGGRYFVLNQDDDHFHQDFLKNAHEALSAHPEATVYGAAFWKEKPNRGYWARSLRDLDYDPTFLLQDRPVVIPGDRMAVRLLDQDYLYHPALAYRMDRLRAIGGFADFPLCAVDILTTMRMLIGGALAYDARVGAVMRLHAGNLHTTQKKRTKECYHHNTFVRQVEILEKAGIDWQPLLREELKGYSEQDLRQALRNWTRYRAPLELQRLAWQVWSQASKGSVWKRWRRTVSRIRPTSMVRFAMDSWWPPSAQRTRRVWSA